MDAIGRRRDLGLGGHVVGVKVTIPVLATKADKLDLTAFMREAAKDIKASMVTRVQAGTDTQGRPFAPYSASYAAQRQKEGRGASPVNLTRSGNMLRAIQASAGKLSCRVFIPTSRDEAIYGEAHQAGNARLPQRRWWGATNAKWSEILKGLHKEISKQLHVPAGTKQISGGN